MTCEHVATVELATDATARPIVACECAACGHAWATVYASEEARQAARVEQGRAGVRMLAALARAAAQPRTGARAPVRPAGALSKLRRALGRPSAGARRGATGAA